MFKLSKSNGINPHVRTVKGETVDELKDLYSGQFTEIFRSALLSLNKSDMMKLMGNDIFSAKNAVSKYYEDAQEQIGASLIPVLEAWDSKGEYEKNKDGSYKRKDSLASFSIDKFGKSSLDYLREMRNLLVEGIVVFPTRNVGTGYRSGGKGVGEGEVYKSRKSRLQEIKDETKKISDGEQVAKLNNIKSYTEEERKKLRAKGIMVADSVTDITMDATNTELTDMFRTYVERKDSEGTSANQLGNAGGWVKKMFSKGSKKVNGVRDVFDNIFSMPGRVLSNVFNELDNGLYKLIFGVNQDGSDQSFLSKVVTSIKSEFSEFFNWTKETFFTPLHDMLLGEKGILTKMQQSEAMKSIKRFGNKMADWAFGDLDENGHRRNGAFSEAFNDIKDIGNSAKRTITGKGYVDRFGNVHGADANSVFGNVNNVMSSIYQNSKLYLFGNKKDQYIDAPMLIPTAFGNIAVPQNQLSPIQSLYTPEAAAKMQANANRPSVFLNNPSKANIGPEIASPLLASYLENNNLTANGGSSIFDWLKNNLSLQYSVGVNGKQGEAKTVKFGENATDSVGSGGIAPTMVNGFPYYSQKDPRYANMPYNLSTGKGGGQSLAFGDRGCGPTAMSMVASGLGENVDPLDMANMATETGHSVEGGTKGSFFKSIGEKLGLRTKEKQTTASQVESALIQGKPMILRGRKTSNAVTPFTSDGHFVVGVGGKNGKIQINDPNGVESSGLYDIKDIVGESNKMWTFDDTGKGSEFNPSGPKYNVVNTRKKKDKYITDWSIKASHDGSGEINGAVTELAEGFREASADLISLIFGEKAGEEDREARTKKFSDKFREALPKGISGGILGTGLGAIVGATGGMGLMGSFFLPGGPIGGAILGTALGFATQSNKFKDWLFGKEDPKDSTKRIGGFISEKTQKLFKEHKSTIIGGAALGGLKGMIGGTGILGTMLFGGPITGALVGAGIGLGVRSKKFQETVFGKEDKDTGKKVGGLLSKSYNKVVDNKKLIAGAGVGLLGGMGVGALMSSMGILGGTLFMGPIGGAIAGAGMGIAVASEKWRDKVFGKFNDDKQKREGGLIDEVKTSIKNEILAPLKETMTETTLDLKYWFQEAVMLPVANAFEPFKKVTGMIADDIMYNFRAITESIGTTFNKYIGEPIQTFLHDSVFKPLQDGLGKMFKMTMSVTKTILGAPFKLLDMASWTGSALLQHTAKKRQKKSNKAAEGMSSFEEIMMDRDLSKKEQKQYDKLRRRRDRFFVAEDDERLTFLDTWSERRKSQKEEIQKEAQAKKNVFARLKGYNRDKREFEKIFGPDVKFDSKLLDDYRSIALRENNKKIKGWGNKKAVKTQQAEFVKQFHENNKKAKESGAEVVAPDVAKIKDTLMDNLSPIRGSLYKIENMFAKMMKRLEAKSFSAIQGIKGDDEGQGGKRDAAWMMTGKGGEKDKKKNIFSSFGNTMVSALKKFDKVNDAEEDKKAKDKAAKAELAEKQKSVSSKNYLNMSKNLKAKAKEEEERTFRDKLLNAVENIKTTTGSHKVDWEGIFGKKGLVTGALLLALPFVGKFLQNPAEFIGDLMGSIMNGITISIGWLFGKDNKSRTDSFGNPIDNTGLASSTGRLARNSGKKVLTSGVVEKGSRLATKVGITSASDLSKLGVDLSTKKGVSKIGKMGMKLKGDLGATESLASLATKSIPTQIKEGATKIAQPAVSKVVETSNKLMNSKFVTSILDWLKVAFTNKKVVKELGEEAAKNTLSELTEKVSKALTEKVLSRFAPKISAAIAKVAGRVGGAAATAGIVTVAFGVTDFISGAVNAERLFEIPPGTATFGMRTMAAVLQTILGLGMIGPLIDVANEIIAEVTGISFLTLIATVGYSWLTKAVGGDIELKNLQAEFSEDYQMYKEANGLSDLSKRAYQDVVNPTFGSKITNGISNAWNKTKEFGSNVWNKTKEVGSSVWNKTKEAGASLWESTKSGASKAGHFLTGNLFNDSKIRQELGLNENVDLTLKDRVSMGASSLIERMTGGTVKTEDTIKVIYGYQTKIANAASNVWQGVQEKVSTEWNNAKGIASKAIDGAGKKITGMLGLLDGNNQPLPLGEGISVVKDAAIEAVKTKWNDIKTKASNWWDGTKETVGAQLNYLREETPKALNALNTNVGSLLGFQNDDGEPVSMTEGISLGAQKFMTGISDTWKFLKDESTKFWDEAKTVIGGEMGKLKKGLSSAMDELNKGLGRLMGFEDENGKSLSLTDAVKTGWSKTVSTANNLWTSFKNWIGIDSAVAAAETNISARNNAASASYSAYGGFGGESIPTNIGARGCGPTAMSMVASKLTGTQVDPVTMSNLATQGGYAGQYGTNGKYFTYAASKLGINASEGKTTTENLTRALSAGQPVILRGQSNGEPGSAFTRSGHYVVAVGQKDGKIIINDPRGVKYSGAYDMNDVVSQSNVMWSFGQQQGPYGTKIDPLILGGSSSESIPGELIYKYAAVHVGKPYVWGAEGPNSFDCSGLVNVAAKQAGVKLPVGRPTAASWRNYCKTISRDQLRVGDLGFYRQNGKITHVAIYAGDGQWCHAEGGSGPKGQGGKVKINSPTYLNEFGRIPGVSSTVTQYVGNVTGLTNTGSKSSGSLLSDMAGFISSIGKNAINAAITGQSTGFMTFDEYLAGNNSSTDSSYSGESVSLGSRKTDAATLNRYLGGRLANKGDTIVRISNKYGVDPAFAASIMHHESANGTSNAIVKYNNPGGIMDPATNWSKLKSFSNLDAGIEYTVSNLKSGYLDKGLTTIPAIGNKYAPVGASNDPNNQNTHWVPNVTKLYNQYSYDGYGGFSDVDTKGTAVNKDTIGGSLFGYGDAPVSKTYTFNDRTSNIGMGDNYVRNMVNEQLKDTSGTLNVSTILEKVLDILSRIADNTGITSKNIKDAITTVMTSNTAITNVNAVSGGKTTTKTSVNTNAQYSETEMRNRNIAQQIAQGRFV